MHSEFPPIIFNKNVGLKDLWCRRNISDRYQTREDTFKLRCYQIKFSCEMKVIPTETCFSAVSEIICIY